MVAHPFLSEAWIEAARELQAEYQHRVSPPEEPVRLNITVTDAPFGDGRVLGHLDTTAGSVVPELGHIDDPDVALTIPYTLARNLLVDRQFDQLMISFMSGEIEVAGDVTLIMALQDLEPTEEQRALADEVADALRAITE